MTFIQKIENIKAIAIEAGEIIMKHYNAETAINTKLKTDATPVTIADLEAHHYITQQLREILPNIKIISEEDEKFADITTEAQFILIDPLDGTKGFIKKNGEFTVNIGFIEGNKAKYGVVYVPYSQILYYTGQDGKVYKENLQDKTIICLNDKRDKSAKRDKGKKSNKHAKGDSDIISLITSLNDGRGSIEGLGDGSCQKLRVVASKAHLDETTKRFLQYLEDAGLNLDFVQASSSLKFCLMAESEADLYPRFSPTMEWDTAAGHAIVTAAGGYVFSINTIEELIEEARPPHNTHNSYQNEDKMQNIKSLIYGKQDFKNTGFLCCF